MCEDWPVLDKTMDGFRANYEDKLALEVWLEDRFRRGWVQQVQISYLCLGLRLVTVSIFLSRMSTSVPAIGVGE